MRRLSRDHTSLFFDPAAPPLAEVQSGERFIVETADSLCGTVKAEVPKGHHIDEVLDRLGGACPVTGPVYVRGAQPGMVLAVTIHSVNAVPASGQAWTGVFEGFGALSYDAFGLQEGLTPETRLLQYDESVISFDRSGGPPVPIPMQPFLGTVGVAPKWERRLSFSQSIEYLGDVDLPQITTGATLLLPVNVDGALLSVGDAHGAQGDGEITGAAIEIEAEAELSCTPKYRDEAEFVGLPQLNTESTIGSIAAFQGNDLTWCARAAYTDLVRRLVRFYGFTAMEAYQLLGQVGRLRVGNMIDPYYSILAFVDRAYVHGA